MAAKGRERDDEDLVRVYLGDIGRYSLLTKDDEADLARQMEEGLVAQSRLAAEIDLSPATLRRLRRLVSRGEEARYRFVLSNLRLVVSVAKRYHSSGLPLLDLIQEGNIGLMHAVEKFDWRRGFKFSTYATWWIRQAITRGVANTGRTIRLPVHAGDLLTRIQRSQTRLELRLGRPPTSAELAAEAEVSEERLTEALLFRVEPLSLSERLRDDAETELGELVEDSAAETPFDAVASSMLPEQISRLLGSLDEREQAILRMRFGLDRDEPRTLEEVGAHFNLTRERIRQIESRAMSKLRRPEFEDEVRDLMVV